MPKFAANLSMLFGERHRKEMNLALNHQVA